MPLGWVQRSWFSEFQVTQNPLFAGTTTVVHEGISRFVQADKADDRDAALKEIAGLAFYIAGNLTVVRQHTEVNANNLIAHDQTITSLMGQTKNQEHPYSWKGRISESKGASTINTFTGNKREAFKEWNENLLNQFSVIYQGPRGFFKRVIKELDTIRKDISVRLNN